MYFQKRKYFVLRVSLFVIFLLVSMKSSVFALICTPKNGNDLHNENEDVIEIKGKSRCGLMDDSCCCDISVTNNNHSCCCTSSTLGKESVDLVTKTSKDKFFIAFFNSIKCFDVTSVFQNSLLSDYEPFSRNTLLVYPPNACFQAFLKDCHYNESHLFLPFKPPKHISKLHIS